MRMRPINRRRAVRMRKEGDSPQRERAPEEGETSAEPVGSPDRALICRRCHARLSHPDAVFRMDARGAVSAFANPAGYLRQIVTVRYAENVAPVGNATTEFTWFAGYAWTVALCTQCGVHVGWIYEAVGEGSPARFYGLLTEAIEER